MIKMWKIYSATNVFISFAKQEAFGKTIANQLCAIHL